VIYSAASEGFKGAAAHRVRDGKIHNNKVSQCMQHKPTSRTAAAEEHVHDAEGANAQQNLEEDIKHFTFERRFEEQFQRTGDHHPDCGKQGNLCAYARSG
jgi:hypothetical protein